MMVVFQVQEAKEQLVKLEPILAKQPVKRRLGGARGAVLYMADDFDAPLADFEDYM